MMEFVNYFTFMRKAIDTSSIAGLLNETKIPKEEGWYLPTEPI